MDLTLINPDDPKYPSGIAESLGNRPTIPALGNLDLLGSRPLAFFSSIKCPGDVILKTYDLIRSLRDAGVPVIGGFHSPMEKECLALLLRGRQPVIVCPARSIEGMRLPSAWKRPLADGRLLVLSPFGKKYRRITAETAAVRNVFVAALAYQVFIAHAAPGSKTEQFCRELISTGEPLWTLASSANGALVAAGARTVSAETVAQLAV